MIRSETTLFTLRLSPFHLILFIVLLLFRPSVVDAQVNASGGMPSMTSYAPKVYKGNNQVWSIIQDDRGFMYFGTSGGIMEYNGVDWNKLKFPRTSSSISNRCFYKDKGGRIFYGSIGDLGYFDVDKFGNTKMVSLFDFIPTEYRNFNDIWTILQVGTQLFFQARDFIYIFDISQGLDSPDVHVWTPDTEFMYAFYENGQYIVHQQELGLFKLVENKLELIPGSEFLGKERVQVLMPYSVDNEGESGFLIGMFASGIYKYNGKDFKTFHTEANTNTGKNETRLYKGLKLEGDRYALAFAGHGLSIIDKFGRVQYLFNVLTGIPDESIYSIYVDKSGMLWLGTENGIAKIEIFSPLSRFTFSETLIPNILSLNNIGNDLYLGTATEVLKLDHKDGKIKSVPDIPTSQVFKMEKDGEDLLVASEGLIMIRKGKASFVKESVGGNFSVLDILISKRYPDLMYCSGSFGLGIFQRGKAGDDWIFLGTIDGISKEIYSLIEDGDGVLWGGTSAEVVYKIELGLTATKAYDLRSTTTELIGREQGLVNAPGAVFKVRNKAYFPTTSGFFTYNKKTNRFEKDSVFIRSAQHVDFGAENSLLIEDNLGRVLIYFGDVFKLAIPQPNGGFILNDHPVNLFTGEIITSFFSEPDSTIWLGTDEGLIRIADNGGTAKGKDFQLYLTQITSGSDTLSHVIPTEGDVMPERDFKNNSLRFEFASPFFDQENLILFQTFLEGFDEEWSTWDKNTYKEYTKLPPGTYTFRIRAKNVFNTTSNEVTYSFVIMNPWFSTWWAYVLYFLTASLMILGLVRYRSRQLKSQNLILEKKVTVRTEQLKKSLDDLRSTQEQLIHSEKMASLGELTAGIAHEIQNPLNFVNNFSEVNMELIDEMSDEIQKGNIDGVKAIASDIKENELKINHHGKRADAIVKGMLQHSRTSSGAKEPTDINVLADEYLRLAYHGLRAKDKTFNATLKTEYDKTIGSINIIPQEIGRVILNLINNSFYAVKEKKSSLGSTYEPIVIVATKIVSDKVIVTVKDNGNGIPVHIMEKIFQPFFTTKPTGQGTGLGLSLSYDIVKAHGGEINVKTEENKGTEFIITLPL